MKSINSKLKCSALLALGFLCGQGSFAAPAEPNDTVLFREPYRPQYHFTPAHRWIGDPSGLVKKDGKYLGYSWGGVESDDLVNWKEKEDHAIKGLPPKTSAFTGSVVVDSLNTAGWGKDAMIAVFTLYDQDSKKQSQGIAFSLDGGETYQYYDQNPVLDIWSTEFRDPTVIDAEVANLLNYKRV